jgi:hypothetical protein
MLKVGEMSYDNIYEQEIKEVTRKETNEIKFLTKLSYLTRLFTTLDEDSKVSLFMKAGSPLICIEKGADTNTRTFIAAVAGDEDDEEKIEEVLDTEDEE